eukprot:1003576-Amphidinium_carterae.1
MACRTDVCDEHCSYRVMHTLQRAKKISYIFDLSLGCASLGAAWRLSTQKHASIREGSSICGKQVPVAYTKISSQTNHLSVHYTILCSGKAMNKPKHKSYRWNSSCRITRV